MGCWDGGRGRGGLGMLRGIRRHYSGQVMGMGLEP